MFLQRLSWPVFGLPVHQSYLNPRLMCVWLGPSAHVGLLRPSSGHTPELKHGPRRSQVARACWKRDMSPIRLVKFPLQAIKALIEKEVILTHFFSRPSWKRSPSTLTVEKLG